MKRTWLLVALLGAATLLTACGNRTPTISETALAAAIATMEEHSEVVESSAIIQTPVLGLVLMLDPNTPTEVAQELGLKYARTLASEVAAEHGRLMAPREAYLGELYDHYELHMYVLGSMEHIIAHGLKPLGENRVYW